MSNLSVATVIEKNRIHSDVAFVALLEIEVINPDTGALVETLRLARNSEEIVFGGNTYPASSWDFEVKSEMDALPDVRVVAKDYTRAIQARMQQYRGGVGFNVRITVVNTANLDQPAEASEVYKVIGANAKNHEVVFRLGLENPLGMRFPRRRQSRDRCNWIYKGAQCKYAGSLASCDFTLQGANGCAVHKNTRNFGGFPGIRAVNDS